MSGRVVIFLLVLMIVTSYAGRDDKRLARLKKRLSRKAMKIGNCKTRLVRELSLLNEPCKGVEPPKVAAFKIAIATKLAAAQEGAGIPLCNGKELLNLVSKMTSEV